MKKIAIVEDNPDNMLLVQTILEDQFEISEYETGPQALEGMHNDLPDLVLLDISLPEMDGIAVLENMRNDEKLNELPVIALTAHAMMGDREKYLNLGFNEYITKPITDEKKLFEVINKCLTLN